MHQDLRTTIRALLPALLAAALTAGCASLAEDVASHLVENDLKAVDQDLGVVEGDLAKFRRCFKERGGSCQGNASTPLPHGSHNASSRPVTPVNPGGSQTVAHSVASLPAGHSAKIAHDVLSHTVVRQAAAVHDHLRGHDAGSTAGVSVQQGASADGGQKSTVTMDLKLGHAQQFQGRLLSSVRTGGWDALHHHCQSVLVANRRASDYDEIEATCRHAAFVRGYLGAYLRKGDFLQVDVSAAGVISKIQDAGTKIQNDIQSLQDKITRLETDVGKAETDATSDLATLGHKIATDVGDLNQKIRDAESHAHGILETGIAELLGGLATQIDSAAGQLAAQVGSAATEVVHTLAQELDELIGDLETEIGKVQTKVGDLDQDLVNDVTHEVGKANSKLSDVFRVSNVGFVSRDSTFRARLPTVEATIDPTAERLVRFTDRDDADKLLTGRSSFSHLGVASDTSGVGTGSSIGTELVRVFFEALFDACEGLPAIAPANQSSIRPTGLTLGAYSLPTFTTSQGHIDAHDLAKLTEINDRVATSTQVLVGRIVSGIGPFSLNNPSLEALITEIVATSVRKATEKMTWCWYACNLDADVAKLEADIKKAIKDEQDNLRAKWHTEKQKLEAKLHEVQTRLQTAIQDADDKAQAAIKAEASKLQAKLEAAEQRLHTDLQKAANRVERHAEHVHLRLRLRQ